MNNFEKIRNDGRLLYEYIRGSHLYGLNVETSDVDHGGVFICTNDELLGLPSFYNDTVSDSKHDNTWYEIGKYIALLGTSNPTMLESLFVPKELVVGEIHPIIQHIIDNRNIFLTKQCCNAIFGYARAQIHKARGLNKKIVQPVLERKDVLDFCYTFKGQGSESIKDFLNSRNLDQKYCGLINIPNMKDTYGVYYDFAAYLNFEHTTDFAKTKAIMAFIKTTFGEDYWERVRQRIINKDFYGLCGIIHPDGTSNEVRLSSIPKGEKLLCNMTYNQNGYESHCKKYKEYKEWEKNRNPIRYESNLNKNYDSKNMMHCVRLIHMGLELARGEGFNIVRTWDREFLLSIRNHEMEYDDLISYVEEKYKEFNEALETSTLPKEIDQNLVNQLLIDVRKLQLETF